MRALSPVSLVAACWGTTCLIALIALARPDTFDLLPVLMHRESLTANAFAPLGMAWISIAALIFVVSDFACKTALPAPRPFAVGLSLTRAAQLTFWANLTLLGITAIWVLLTARQVGGLTQLANIALLDTLTARDLLLDNKLFTGMRLFYASLPATGCLAAAILTAGRGHLRRSARRLCIAVLVMNAVALTILPIVMSQRLLLLQFLLSAYLVSCLIRGRIFGLVWVGVGTALFLSVWIMRESLTNPLLHRSGVDIGLQKLAFYFVNDLWNSFAPLQIETQLTLGAVSLRGLMFLTFTDGMFDRLLATRLTALDEIRGGGEFSLFVAPYVDFGPIGAALFLFLAGFAFRLAFHKGQQSLIWAAIYAQTGAALLFSSHGLYVTHQNFLFSLVLMAGLMRLARNPVWIGPLSDPKSGFLPPMPILAASTITAEPCIKRFQPSSLATLHRPGTQARDRP